MINKKTIGKRLAQLRGAKTQKEVAKDLGISLSAICMYENGSRVPRDEIKIAFAKYYSTSVEDLFFTNNVHKA
ncbi:MAG: helix-turn-helix transcriptional regulator [Bacillota bacterium]|jgi:putative transcriptional regulator